MVMLSPMETRLHRATSMGTMKESSRCSSAREGSVKSGVGLPSLRALTCHMASSVSPLTYSEAVVPHAAPAVPSPSEPTRKTSSTRLVRAESGTASSGLTASLLARKAACSTRVSSAAGKPSARITVYSVAAASTGPLAMAGPIIARSSGCAAKRTPAASAAPKTRAMVIEPPTTRFACSGSSCASRSAAMLVVATPSAVHMYER
mmetsp:Transcript_12340/g.30739  ORF Transcript_12340/g.30739 Transcript_12340/m.30739 type:complete len:205 (+) Transcript_12340:850-1464(+)